MAPPDDDAPYILPTLYAPWIAELLSGGTIPAETKATCEDCAMCTKGGPVADRNSFDPHVKCCSYEPRIPNFMVGRILADPSSQNAAGRESVLARIQKQLGVSLLGLVGSARYGLLYQYQRDGFGRAPDLICPHYVDAEDGGHCGIWAHRPVVCATWFCKHDRGAVGQKFWLQLSELLRATEMELSIWCAAKLGANSAALFTLESGPADRLDRAELGGPLDMERHRLIWGNWTGKEPEYYQACAGLVAEIGWPQVSDICGPRTQVLVKLLKEAYHSLISADLPLRLKVGPFKVDGAENGKLRVVTYSGYDPLAISENLTRALPYFSGQPRTEALESIQANLGLRLTPQLVRRLADFQLLVECKEPEGQ